MGSSSFLRNIFWNVEKWHLKRAVPVSTLEHSVYKHQNFAEILMKSLAQLPVKGKRLRGTPKKRCNSIDECAKYFYRLTLKLNCHANFLPDLKKSFSVKWREHTFVYIPTFFIFAAFIQAVDNVNFFNISKKVFGRHWMRLRLRKFMVTQMRVPTRFTAAILNCTISLTIFFIFRTWFRNFHIYWLLINYIQLANAM